ncbi:MAG: UDP-N-acetylmuramoyl-L-alanine--D-glutamate ligase [Candidatus Sumerlaeota bacterium]|nr:UDP-N-acetylmuramoyl-L-alanine--D-glutamate ligase [Candidatus Sumerlaeota bacterium]
MMRDPEKLKGIRWLVMGAGRSGKGAVRLLRRAGYETLWVDEKKAPEGHYGPVLFGPWRPEWLDGMDGVIWSPGIPLDHPLAQEARIRGMEVISEIELAWRFAQAPVIAVTGSNGKTTTTSWIAYMLRTAERRAVECGNIGRAFSEVIADEEEGAAARAETYVVEVSSFQLESIARFNPQIALLLNITANHLDRYSCMDAYALAKGRIALNMGRGQSLIVNGEDDRCLGIARQSGCEVVFFGRATHVLGGALLDETRLIWRPASGGENDIEWVCANELIPPGAHNVQNALAAAAAARLMGADDDSIRRGLRDFKGVEHRIEFVAEISGVPYYNDSKSTTVPALEAALRSFALPIVLIAGGRDKKAPFGDVAALVRERVAHIVLMGEAAGLIASHWADLAPITMVSDLKAALVYAGRAARPGQVVLFSPACASFDQYKDFEERGRDFKHRVLEIKES